MKSENETKLTRTIDKIRRSLKKRKKGKQVISTSSLIQLEQQLVLSQSLQPCPQIPEILLRMEPSLQPIQPVTITSVTTEKKG